MNQKNIKIHKKLCILAAICILTASQAFAETETIDSKYLEKSVKQEKMDNISPEYLFEIEKFCYRQIFSKEYDKALKTADYLISANKAYFGEKHPQTGFAYLARARYYNTIIMPDKAKSDFDNVYILSLMNSKNTDLRGNSYIGYINFYSTIEQPQDALEYLKKLYVIQPDSANNAKRYKEFAQIYAVLKDFKNAKKYYDKYYSEIIKDKNNLAQNKLNYYMDLASLYKDNSQYNLTLENIKNAENIISQIPDIDSNSLFNLYINKSQYFHEIKNHEAEKKELDKANEIAIKSGDINQIDTVWNYYFDYYKDIKDYKTSKKYLKKEQNLNTKIPKNSLLFLRLAEKEIDLYKDINKFQKAEKLAAFCVESIEPVNEYAPVLYGKFLRKLAEVKMALNEEEQAKQLLDKAQTAYKSVLPDTAYEFYELYKNYADLYLSQQKTDEAIKEYIKALKINTALQGENHKDAADIYRQLANIYEDSDSKKAEDYNKKAEEIYKKCYGI